MDYEIVPGSIGCDDDIVSLVSCRTGMRDIKCLTGSVAAILSEYRERTEITFAEMVAHERTKVDANEPAVLRVIKI
jgi:hypothetical protein